MAEIHLKHAIRKGEFSLNIDTRIPCAGITGVFGESGSGKTTLLRCIAGLEGAHKPDLAVHKRRVAYVFQEPQLFPHLSVRKNIEFGMRRNPGAKEGLERVAELLDIEKLLERAIRDLSGGEAQRVSIARALCQSPQLILMDEPLSALDERRRNEVLPFLDRLHADTSVPIIYVSHNIDEICRLSDHLLVLDRGQIAAEGSLRDTLTRIDLPQLGGRNAGTVIDVVRIRHDSEFDLTLFGFSGGEIWAPGYFDRSTVRLRVSASDISLNRSRAEASTILNIIPAVIEAAATETAATELLRLRAGDDVLVARITRRSMQQLELRVGDRVYAQIKSVTVRR
jgi:molybdate transport system ATP-binding protein